MSINEQSLLRLPHIIGDSKKGIPAIIPISRSAWLSGVREGRYPKPVKLGPKTTAWRAAEILELAAKGV